MIRIRAWSALGMVILKGCPCGLWIALPVSRTRQSTPVLHIYRHLRQSRTRQSSNEFKNSRWDIGWHDSPFCFEIAIYAQRQHTAECIRYKCDTMSFGATREIRTPQELTDWTDWQDRIGAGLWNFVRGWGKVFWNFGGHCNEVNIDLHRLWGKTDVLVGLFHAMAPNIARKTITNP